MRSIASQSTGWDLPELEIVHSLTDRHQLTLASDKSFTKLLPSLPGLSTSQHISVQIGIPNSDVNSIGIIALNQSFKLTQLE